MNDDELLARLVQEQAAAISRQVTAEFCLGPKGEHFDGDDWERRADLLSGPDAGRYLRGGRGEA